jgi:hypothetical protein
MATITTRIFRTVFACFAPEERPRHGVLGRVCGGAAVLETAGSSAARAVSSHAG